MLIKKNVNPGIKSNEAWNSPKKGEKASTPLTLSRGLLGVNGPHPDPLPQGEGTARIAQWRSERSGLFSAQRMVHPLPWGEGWGEGKQTTAPHSKSGLNPLRTRPGSSGKPGARVRNPAWLAPSRRL